MLDHFRSQAPNSLGLGHRAPLKIPSNLFRVIQGYACAHVRERNRNRIK